MTGAGTREGAVPARLRTSPAAAAAILLAATAAALVWANLPGSTYEDFWHTPAAVTVGGAGVSLDLRHWVNDALMALFFFMVSLEARRELAVGELRDRRRARVPVIAAVTGLLLPAGLYVVLLTWADAPREAVSAWGVVISTDTAFALGLLAVVGRRAPAALRLFLLTLAVVDDVGALAVVALAYTDELRLGPLAVAGVATLAIAGLRHLRVWRGLVYLVLAAVTWVAVLESGVHATIAGVAIGLAMPVYPPRREKVEAAMDAAVRFSRAPNPRRGRDAALRIARAVSVNERLHTLYAPYVNLVVVPVFALANAGVALDGPTLRSAAVSPVTWAVVVGLVGGKLFGITLGTRAAVALRLGRLAPGLHTRHLVAGGLVSGMGFTISLFIVDLALTDPVLRADARIGVLAASVLAALLATGAFALAARTDRHRHTAPDPLIRPVDPARDHLRGDPGAPTRLAVYASFAFPDAGRAVETVEELRSELGDRLVFTFRHLPTDDPVALEAAQAAEEAAAQGRFWPMHDALAARTGRLTSREVRRCGAEAGLNLDRLDDALRRGTHLARVTEDVADAATMRLPGPPAFFVDDRRYDGPVDVDELRAALLAGAASPTTDTTADPAADRAAGPAAEPHPDPDPDLART
ncbi:Na+/H+ antiporter NhaA [Cellulomonas endometrii]|uniref:Na+/H+ antiporter NhaA n=1 Tax=Cellulomonas endometrii TaxID=3036301 RepID=UPI0024AE4EC5|nr:Na+/H+ antiporter NhaA [Cellulomonas endometrii]